MIFSQIFLSVISILLILGIFIILVLISNIKIDKKLKEVNDLINGISEDNTHHRKPNRLYYIIKRLLDLLMSSTGIIILSPVFILVTVLIKLETGGPIFIRKRKIGKYGIAYNAYEFSTRKHYRNNDIDRKQFTKVGLFIYRTSIYELPKLINVIKGNMSIVGISEYNEIFYNHLTEKIKNEIEIEKPGIVSLWAVSFDKQEFDFTKKYFFDLYYVSNISLWFDLCIIFKTFILIFAITGDY